MARSEIKTWLALDEFARIIGLSPLGFNQLQSNQFSPSVACGEVFFQQSWLHADRVGRDDIAMAIQQAEQEISKEVGFNLLPDWTVEERLPYPQPATPELFGTFGVNARWQGKSVELPRGHIISGGVKTKTLIQAGVTFTRSDIDSDGFQENCTLTIPTTVTDANEIRLFYPAQAGSDEWEIRPIKVSFSGANVTIQFKIWQVVAANQMDSLDANVLDADSASSYETTVDVYRVYNDPATQAQFLWEGQPDYCCGTCVACQLSSQAACFHLRDPRMGFAVPSPASWDNEEEEFTSQPFAACREPDQVRFWYLSGFRDMTLSRPMVEMSHYWKYAVAYFAASKFDRQVCGCSNVQQFVANWKQDVTFTSEGSGSYTTTAEMISNRLGTTMGALYAWRRIQQNGVRIIK